VAGRRLAGIAVHFNWDAATQTWRDDKSLGYELYAFLAQVMEKAAGLKMTF